MSFIMLWENRKLLFGNFKMMFTLLPKLLFWMVIYYFWFGLYCIIAKKGEYEEDFPRLVRIKERIATLIINSHIQSIVDSIIPDEILGRTIDKSDFDARMDGLKK